MTIIVKKNYSSSLFKIVKEKLNNLELVSLPTETVYGLAGLGTKIESAKKIYKLKKYGITFHMLMNLKIIFYKIVKLLMV